MTHNFTQKVFSKIKNKIKAMFVTIEKGIDSLLIYAFANYSSIKAPEVSLSKIKLLRDTESVLSILLSLNGKSVADADKIIRGNFRVLGLNIKKEGYSTNHFWHTDFYSNHHYKVKPYPIINIKINEGHDIIVPWELSRFLFVPTLVQAFIQTENQKYVHCFLVIVDEWMNQNPYMQGVNWMTGMDVAARMFNLGVGIVYFFPFLPKDKKQRYLDLIWAHVLYIYKKDFSKVKTHRNNHFFVSIFGLLFITPLFNSSEAKKYHELALRHFENEILIQFNEEGVNFEGTDLYHALSLEAVLLGVLSLKLLQNQSIAAKLLDRISKSVRFISTVITNMGGALNIGDSADGRLFFFKDYFQWTPDKRKYIVDLAKAAIDYNDKELACFDPCLFSLSELAMYRNKKYSIFLNNWRSPIGHTGHNHLDKCSVLLNIKDQPLFIDSGTFNYTPDVAQRNNFRRTRAHNVVMIDGQEQINCISFGVFAELTNYNSTIRYHNETTYRSFLMSHSGYERIPGLGKLDREVQLQDNLINIIDSIEGHGSHLMEIVFNLHPDINVKEQDRNFVFWRKGYQIARICFESDFELSIEDMLYSPYYRKATASKRIIAKAWKTLPAKIRSTIVISDDL